MKIRIDSSALRYVWSHFPLFLSFLFHLFIAKPCQFTLHRTRIHILYKHITQWDFKFMKASHYSRVAFFHNPQWPEPKLFKKTIIKKYSSVSHKICIKKGRTVCRYLFLEVKLQIRKPITIKKKPKTNRKARQSVVLIQYNPQNWIIWVILIIRATGHHCTEISL